jgi:hypothetical protein
MSIVKDIIIETAKRMPEDITFESAAYEILNVGTTFEELQSSKEGRSISIEELFDIIIPEGESDDERILRRAKEAEKAYRDGDVKIGNFEDFWKDMND